MAKLLSQYFRCTALRIIVSRPKLSFVYCTGKVSGWFFRREMSDLFIYNCRLVYPDSNRCHKEKTHPITICASTL